jgi:hypothetical protein
MRSRIGSEGAGEEEVEVEEGVRRAAVSLKD